MNDVLILSSIFCSLFFSILSFIFMLFIWIEKRTTDKSTHTIEYRDPFKVYDDELELENKSGTVTIKENKTDSDMQDDSTINEMNKFIEEEGVIL